MEIFRNESSFRPLDPSKCDLFMSNWNWRLDPYMYFFFFLLNNQLGSSVLNIESYRSTFRIHLIDDNFDM